MVDAMRESMESLQHQLEAVQKQLAEQGVFNQNIIREWSNRLAMTEATLQQKFDKELKEEVKELNWKKKCSEGGFDERISSWSRMTETGTFSETLRPCVHRQRIASPGCVHGEG